MLRKITIQSNFMKPLTCIICMMKGFCIRMSHECGDLSDAYDACEKKIREVNGSGLQGVENLGHGSKVLQISICGRFYFAHIEAKTHFYRIALLQNSHVDTALPVKFEKSAIISQDCGHAATERKLEIDRWCGGEDWGSGMSTFRRNGMTVLYYI